jgi:putative methyltransferase
METISFVNANFQQGPKEINAYYLPYTVGCLWAYAKTHETIDSNLKLNKLIWRRDNVDEVVSNLQHDKVVAFSCYVWNKNYHYAIAKKLKEVNPNILLVFGGPEIPITNPELFKLYPFMDVVVKSEGEIAFRDLLVAYIENNNIETIPGLLINYGGNIKNTGTSARISDLEILPSPYLTGVFNDIMSEVDDVEWNGTLETNRGCPYKCTFCDWGSLTHSKVKKVGLDRVFAELDWMAKNKIGLVTITDANFGIFIERDNLIADKIIDLQIEYGYPYRWSVTWAKNQKQEVVDIIKKFFKTPYRSNGLSISVQSMNLDVLENIERRNLGEHQITEIFDLCNKNNIPVFTETILGLPGETKESWKDNFWQLFDAGNHTGITIYQAQLLENAQMNLSQREQFDIKSTYVYDYMSGSHSTDELKEEVELVASTKDLSFDDMMDCHLFNWFITTFHIDGLSTYIARIINKHFGIGYDVFYGDLEKFLEKDPWFVKEKKKIRQHYLNWMTKGVCEHEGVGKVEILGWNLMHAGTLSIIDQNKHEHVFGLLEQFVKENFSIDEELVSQLMDFNKNYVVDFNKLSFYPLKKTYDYDFTGYLLHDKPLKNNVTYKFEFSDKPDMTKEKFLEFIHFGKRRDFGKTQVSLV